MRSGASRLTKNLKTAQQSRLEGFFKPVEKSAQQKETLKRKKEQEMEDKKKKQKLAAKEKKEAKAKPRGAA